jgi:glucose 1-dehydrogenase
VELAGRVTLVTGATSGIGLAIARAFAEAGAAVAVNHRGNDEEERPVLAELGQGGRRVIAVRADVASAAEVRAMVDRVLAEFGRIDVLVNNAGIERATPLLEIEESDWDAVLAVDLKGAFLCLQACARAMRERGGGSIINISSIHEDRPFPGYASYCAAKGGLRMLMRDAALELAPYGIRVNNIAPGAIATPINAQTLADPDKLRRLARIVPLGRMGRPEEVAQLAVFLASDRASYVTGATYYVDGGMVQHAEPL